MSPVEMAAIHARAFSMPRPWSQTEFEAALADPLGIVLTESQGFLLGRVVACEAEMLTLAVDPQARRQGSGARLVRAFLVAAQQRGAESIFLEVAFSNHAARALYEKCGFSLRGSRKDYYRDTAGRGEDALILVWGN